MIQGERINIIALENSAKDLILSWANDAELKKYTGTIFPISRDEHEKWFANRATDTINKLYCIYHKEHKKVIGVIGNKETDMINRNTEMYLYIGDKEYRKNGYGTEMVNLFSEFCFKTLNLHKIYMRVFEYNSDALRCYEKCGFNIEGTLKEAIFKEGRYWDVFVMGKIRSKEL